MARKKASIRINWSARCNLIVIVFFVMLQAPAISKPSSKSSSSSIFKRREASATKAKCFNKKIQFGCPSWMREQIRRDLKPFKEGGISKTKLHQAYLDSNQVPGIAKFEIRKNKVHVEVHSQSIETGVGDFLQYDVQRATRNPQLEDIRHRIKGLAMAIQDVCNYVGMADTTFCVFLFDGFDGYETLGCDLSDFPLFVMSRGELPKCDVHSILIPDYDGCHEGYQVLIDSDVTKHLTKWSKKKDTLLWRGSTVQGPHSFEIFAEGCCELPPFTYSKSMNEENAHLFSRYLLCMLSKKYPELIDATYTFSAGLEASFPEVSKYVGNWMSFEKQFNYKYHILLNGNAAPYSNSGWKFFTNSVIFMPEEPFMTQWYYNALKPYEHYIPVRNDLEDLVEKVIWARDHDKQCERIAENAREFAIHNLTRDDYLVYFYYLLKEYSKLLHD